MDVIFTASDILTFINDILNHACDEKLNEDVFWLLFDVVGGRLIAKTVEALGQIVEMIEHLTGTSVVKWFRSNIGNILDRIKGKKETVPDKEPVKPGKPDKTPTSGEEPRPHGDEPHPEPPHEEPPHKEPANQDSFKNDVKDDDLFRGDTRPPTKSDIFNDGFRARGNDYDIGRHKDGNPNSGYIATSTDIEAARGFAYGPEGDGWVYKIRGLDREKGVDIGKWQGKMDREAEIAFRDHIPPKYIHSAQAFSQDGTPVGPPIYNPNFGP